MSPGRRRSQAESVADRDILVRAIADHRHGIRSFLALFAANRTQIDAAESDLWKSWLARPSDASATGTRAGLQRLAADTIARQLDASAANALAGQDPLMHLLSQSGREGLHRPSGSDEAVAHQVQSRLAALDPDLQELLRNRYREHQSNASQAARLGWSSARVDARLHWIRSALDWTAPTAATSVSDAAEGLLPTLIEDYLVGSIDADSRALLVKRAIDDVQVATRVERQVRLDLVLGELLTQFMPADHANFADRLADEPESEPALRTPGSNPRRSAALPPARPATRQRAPLPVPLIGAAVLGCVAVGVLLLVIARPSAPSPATATRSPTSEDHPTATSTAAPSAPPSVIIAPRPTPPAPAFSAPPTSPIPTTSAISQTPPTPVPITEPAATAAIPPPLTSAPVTAPAITVPPKPTPVFVKGIHFGSDAVTIAGNRWQSLKQAEDDGLTLRNSRRVMVSLSPVPAVDADTRSLLISGIAAAKSEPLGLSLALPDGDFEVAVWVMENQRANSRSFDLDISGVLLENLGDLPLGGWATYGPCTVQVRGGKLEITSKSRRGVPQLMGLSIHSSAEVATAAKAGTPATASKVATGYLADFSAGVAKDWQPTGGTWAVANGNYSHTSSDSLDLSLYQAETWSDVVLTASMHPKFDNGYGVVFGAIDAQNYDALYLVRGSAELWRVANGMRTQVAQAACTSVAQWKWSEVVVTRVGRLVSATINGAPIFTNVDLGEAKAGKIGLLSDFNPVDFGGISAAVPKR